MAAAVAAAPRSSVQEPLPNFSASTAAIRQQRRTVDDRKWVSSRSLVPDRSNLHSAKDTGFRLAGRVPNGSMGNVPADRRVKRLPDVTGRGDRKSWAFVEKVGRRAV